YLHAQYPHLHLRIINQGTDGDRSTDLLLRYSDILLYKPDWVVMMIGVNDVWRYFDCPGMKDIHVDCATYQQNLEAIVEQNKENKIKTIFLSPFIMEVNPQDPMRRKLDTYRSAMQKLSEKYGLHYIDVQESFDLLLHEATSYEISRDRIHPNIVGHMVIMKTLIDYIETR
ncbi:MAG: SGNH/GDSL hydrolase family protein, partial [Bacilli bacterium]|nr:SGNH/GDSL hydrolase family protein [Bacilli bacterium]